jgi:hypothetical protein
VGKKSTPTPPDLTPLSNAQLEISRQQLAQAQQQMQMSQSQFDKFVEQTNLEMQQSQKQYDTQMALQNRALDQADAASKVSKSVADKQIEAMNQNMGFAQTDRDRYEKTFIPLQDAAIAEAQGYDTPARREQAASQALADNQTQIEAQRQSTAAQLASMGVDPSQVMSTSLANQMGVAGAATGAMSANNSRLQVENTGRQLRASAIDMGNGLPAQSQSGYNVANAAGQGASNAANGAVGNYGAASGIGATAAGIRQSSLNTASSITGSPMAWASLGNQSYGGASNGIMNSSSIQNQQYQNQMQAQQMKNDQAAATMNAIGSVASIAGMAMMAEGGVVPQYYAEGGSPVSSVDSAPAISWRDFMGPVQDIPQNVKPVTAHVALSGPSTMNRIGGAMAMANQMPGFDGSTPQHAPPQNFLHPIMRAEGGAMGGSGGGSRYQVMPNVQARDQIHAMLTPGEVVVPADVVRIKGQEFFDKLIQKHHRPGA